MLNIKPVLAKILNGTLDPAVRFAEAAVRRIRGLPPDAPVRMSPTQLAWDAFLRRRDGPAPRDFARLRAPGQPGLVSIVLPVHNGQRYLAEALDSVLAQRYPHFELIVVDDGSTDGTADIIARCAAGDGRVRPLRQDRARLPGALNAGFAAARGEFLTWTSDDNRLRPDFLEKMVAALRADPAADFIYANYDLIGEDGELLRDSPVCARLQQPPASGHVRLLHDVSILNLIDGNYVGGAFLYRSRVPCLIGDYSPHRFTCEDYDAWLRLNARMRLRHAPFEDAIYEYRLHGGSLTAQKEALGIDRRTETLLAFDDYRRDLASRTIAWVIRRDPRGGASAAATVAELAGRALRAGHPVTESPRWPPDALPRFGTPAALLFVTDHPQNLTQPPPADPLPPGALRVLVFAGSAPLPAQVDPGWDLCIALSEKAKPVAAGGRRGWLAAGDLETLWRALNVRVHAAQAALAERAAAQAEADPGALEASVVIATTGRRAKLAAAIRSAGRQTLDPSAYEIIVVNNTPEREDLGPLIGELRRELPPTTPLRLVLCPPRGMSLARNAGLAEARGRIVAFLDDDALAEPDWLERLVAAFRDRPEHAVIGGAIRLKEPAPPPSWWTPRARVFWGHLEPETDAFIDAADWRQYPWGGNWAARRAALLAIGGFRARYGRGGPNKTGEDVVAALLLARLGWKIGLEPRARVIHDVDPARFTLRALARTIFDTFELSLPLELDFYLERPAHWPRLVWQGLRHLRHAFYALRKDRFEAVENLCFAAAHARLALKQIRVELHRWRRPKS